MHMIFVVNLVVLRHPLENLDIEQNKPRTISIQLKSIVLHKHYVGYNNN